MNNLKSCSKCTILKDHSEFRADKRNKSLRTPIWANLDRIKDIYNNCPEGYEVDHIIPLRGKTVSGLHVESNLQYLPKHVNRLKRNKYEVN